MLAFAASALLALLLGYILVVIGIAFAVQAWTGWSWWVVTLALALFHLAAAAALAFLVYKRISKPIFEASISELKKDREWLTPKTKPQNPN